MSKIIGKQIELGVGVENVRGTAQSTAEKWFKKITATVVERSEKAVDESTRNVLADSLGARVTKKWVEGDLEGNVHADAIGYIFYSLFGAVSSSNVSGSVYDHVFSVAESIQHASLTLFAKDGANNQDVFNGCMISSLELNAAIDDYVKFTAGFMGRTSSTNSDTPSYDTEYGFVGKDVSVKFADTEGGLAGASAISAKSLGITFDQGLISDHVLGSYNPEDIYNGQMMIEGEINLNYEDDTYKTLFLADTYKYMQITITGSQTIGSTSNPTITIVLNRVQIMDWNREDNRDDFVVQPISFKAFYNETDSEQGTLTLRNLTSEYDSPITV